MGKGFGETAGKREKVVEGTGSAEYVTEDPIPPPLYIRVNHESFKNQGTTLVHGEIAAPGQDRNN